jgi:peptidylamidoglycolate lyase
MTKSTFNRRQFLGMASTLAGTSLLLPRQLFAHDPKAVLGHGSHRYRVVPGWGVQNAAVTPVKDCHEMVQDKKGRLLLLTNETKNNVIIYNKDGKVLGTWGHDFPGAHGLTLWNAGGEEFLFITDHDRHEVYKTTLDGRILMTLKHPTEAGIYASADEFKPTETAIGPNGDIYVADGYGKSYVVQYSPKGEYIRHFGGPGDKEENIRQAHGVALDTRDKKNPTLLVTSRQENALKRFTLDGKLLKTIKLPGAYVCRPVIKGDHVYASVLVSKMPWDSRSGFVTILDKNDKVVSNPGGSDPNYQSGELQPLTQTSDLFKHPHDVCVDNDGNLYVAQWNSDKTYPIKLERV